jgi:hypothetical protein
MVGDRLIFYVFFVVAHVTAFIAAITFTLAVCELRVESLMGGSHFRFGLGWFLALLSPLLAGIGFPVAAWTPERVRWWVLPLLLLPGMFTFRVLISFAEMLAHGPSVIVMGNDLSQAMGRALSLPAIEWSVGLTFWAMMTTTLLMAHQRFQKRRSPA